MHDLDAISLLLSFLLTWVIGLTPPLLIRYVLVKGPMDKRDAILACAALWLFNFVLFIALGSQSKSHAVLILIAAISYGILRRAQSAKELAKGSLRASTEAVGKDASTLRWHKKIVYQRSWRAAVSAIPLTILIVLIHVNLAIGRHGSDSERYASWTPESATSCKRAEQEGLFVDSPILRWQCTEPTPPKSISEYVFEDAPQVFLVWFLGVVSIFTFLSTLSLYLIETKQGWRRLSIVVAAALSVLGGAGYMFSIGRITTEDSGISLAIAGAAFPIGVLIVLGGRRVLLWVKAGFH